MILIWGIFFSETMKIIDFQNSDFSVPNRRVGQNKRAGRKIIKKHADPNKAM